MACHSCKKKKVTLQPVTDDKLLLLTNEEKIETNKKLDRMMYLLDSRTFRTQEGEFIGLYREVFNINLPKPVNQTVIRNFIFKYIQDNEKLLKIEKDNGKESKNNKRR